MHWLDIAAGRGYELARILTAHEELDWVQVSPESDHSAMEMNVPTARLLEMESSRSRAVFEEIDMNHVESFEVYSNGNLDAIKSTLKKSLSRGSRIASIAGYAGCSPQDEAAERGLPLLHWAAGSGRIPLVEAFLEFGADVNATDQFRPWGTPFIYALASGHIDIAEMLLQSGAHVDRSVNDFLFMVPPHRFKRFALLTQQAPRREVPRSTGPHRGPRLGPPGSFRDNETPLSLAAKYNNGLAVKACFGEFGYSWTAEQCYTACKHAAKNLQATLCHFLLCHAFGRARTLHSPLTSVFKGSIYDWMLFHGRDQGWLDALESTIAVLVSHGFDVNGYDEDGKTPMCHAVHYHANEPTVASVLLAHGASLDQQEGEDGRTVLDYAIAAVQESENVGCVRWLLDHNVPLVVQTWVRFKTTPLHHACCCKAYGAVKALLEHGQVDINFLSDQPSHTPLHTACSVNSVPLVQILLQNGADATAVNGARITPLELAVDYLCLEVVDFILSGDYPLENPHFTPPRSILAYCATKSGSERAKISRLIIKHTLRRSPEHLSAVDVDGESPLAKAAQHENHEFMLDLLEAGASIGNPHDAKSAWKYLTSYHGPPYQYYYHTGDTNQMRQYRIVVQALIEDLKKHDQVEARNDDGQTLLCYAAERADVTTVRLLLEAGASPKTATNQGLTPLHVAFMGIMVDGGTVMSWLDQLRSEDNWQGEWAPSASLALLGVVSLLLDAGADPNTSRIDGLTVLHSAILAAWRLDNITGLELLLARGADVNKVIPATRLDGARPVHFALEAPTIIEAWNICCTPMLDELKKQDGRTVRVTRNIVKMLLSCGIDLDVPSDVANTELKPFLQAIRMCDPTSLQVMLQEGVYFKAAITTCSSAAEYAARIIRRRQAEASVDPELVSNLSLSAFVARRAMDEGWQSFEIVADWISGLIESVDIDEVGVTAADAASNRRLCQILRRRDLLSQLMSEDPILPVQPISPSVEITEQQDDQEAGQPQSGETGSTENQNHQRTGQPNRGQGLSILARAAKYGPRSWAQRLSSKEKTQEGSRSQAK
jgi:ankyrin repeat protein